MRHVLSLAALSLLVHPLMFGQGNSGSILGTVTDSSGGVVAAAKVSITNTRTGVKVDGASDNSGNYLFNFLSPGSYRVETEVAGFKKFSREVNLETGRQLRVDVAMETGAVTEVVEQSSRVVRYSGAWKDGVFEYEVNFGREAGKPGIGMIRRRFQPTPEGLIVSVAVDPPAGGGGSEAVGLYRHAEDIPMPTPSKGVIADVAWISGAWVGTRSSGSSIEERWSPPRGGAMLAVSRTVNAGGRMVAFEYLRIVEREGGLVYVAQPGGAPKTEFVLTQFGPTEGGGQRAVFENPRHDYPKRIVYELSVDGKLSATIGELKGGTPRRFDFTREGQEASGAP